MKKFTFLLLQFLFIQFTAKAQDTIPVIFHIVHSGQSVGTGSNLAQARLVSQLQILNADYAGTGYGSVNAPSVWHPANTQIVFMPALYDPQGNLLVEPGIDRINYVSKGWQNPGSFSNTSMFMNYIDNTLKHQGNWPPSLYCNIWVTDAGSSVNLMGWGSLPSNSGLPWATPAWNNADTLSSGIWIWNNVVGNTGSTSNPYNLGRTATHETGHWLGLMHPVIGCPTDSSYCADLPHIRSGTTSSYMACNSTFPDTAHSCPLDTNGTMFMNFMNTYICSDTDIYMFTTCQGNAMRQALHTSPQRSPLLSSNVYRLHTNSVQQLSEIKFEIYPNPATDKLIINAATTAYSLRITDVLGKLVYAEKNLSGKKRLLPVAGCQEYIWFTFRQAKKHIQQKC